MRITLIICNVCVMVTIHFLISRYRKLIRTSTQQDTETTALQLIYLLHSVIGLVVPVKFVQEHAEWFYRSGQLNKDKYSQSERPVDKQNKSQPLLYFSQLEFVAIYEIVFYALQLMYFVWAKQVKTPENYIMVVHHALCIALYWLLPQTPHRYLTLIIAFFYNASDATLTTAHLCKKHLCESISVKKQWDATKCVQILLWLAFIVWVLTRLNGVASVMIMLWMHAFGVSQQKYLKYVLFGTTIGLTTIDIAWSWWLLRYCILL